MLSASAAIALVLRSNNEVFILLIAATVILAGTGFRENRIKTVAAVLLPFFSFFVISTFHQSMNKTNLSASETELIFTIYDRLHLNGNQIRGTIKTTAGEKVMLAMHLSNESDTELASYRPGQSCYASGVLKSPYSARNQYAFDYKRYLLEQRIHWTFEAKPTTFNCVEGNRLLWQRLTAFRAQLIEQLVDTLPEGSRGIVVALTFGDRRYVDPDVLQAYSTLGIIHLLAISGLHVGIVSMSLFYLLIRFGMTRELAMMIMLIVLPIFALLTGAAPPVIRASSMLFVYYLLLLTRIKIHPFYGFSFIFFSYLVIDPYKLFQLGFQLSFLVSFSLILLRKAIEVQSHSYFTRLCSVTLIAQLSGLPLILYHFYEWSPLSLVLNLLYIPFVSLFVLPLSFIGVILHFLIPFQLNPFIVLLDLILVPIHDGVLVLGRNAFEWVIGQPPLLCIAAMYAAIIFMGMMWENNKIRLWALFLPIIVVIAITIFLPYTRSGVVVTMLDVGQGDCIIIEFPYRKAVYVIDTGGHLDFGNEEWMKKRAQFNTGKDIVTPYLKAKGISTITGLILTHGDHDHIGGAAEILNEIDVKEVFYPNTAIEKDNEIELLTSVHHSSANLQFVINGDSINEHFYVLHPTSEQQWSGNDSSIVLFAELDGISFLFTGDLEEDGERMLLQQYPNIKADVLKVGHHGSITSTSDELLEMVSPRIALISAGVNNRFGHPHPDIVAKLDELNIDILRTDLHGSIEMKIVNGDVKWEKTVD